MEYNPWPTDEHELQLDKEHHHERRRESRVREGHYRQYTPGAGRPWWLTAMGTGLLAMGAGVPILRWTGIWQPPACATGRQMFEPLATIALWLSIAVLVGGVIGLLLCAVIRLVNSTSSASKGIGSLAYASFIAVAAGLGFRQTMLLANALACWSAAGAG